MAMRNLPPLWILGITWMWTVSSFKELQIWVILASKKKTKFMLKIFALRLKYLYKSVDEILPAKNKIRNLELFTDLW